MNAEELMHKKKKKGCKYGKLKHPVKGRKCKYSPRHRRSRR